MLTAKPKKELRQPRESKIKTLNELIIKNKTVPREKKIRSKLKTKTSKIEKSNKSKISTLRTNLKPVLIKRVQKVFQKKKTKKWGGARRRLALIKFRADRLYKPFCSKYFYYGCLPWKKINRKLKNRYTKKWRRTWKFYVRRFKRFRITKFLRPTVLRLSRYAKQDLLKSVNYSFLIQRKQYSVFYERPSLP